MGPILAGIGIAWLFTNDGGRELVTWCCVSASSTAQWEWHHGDLQRSPPKRLLQNRRWARRLSPPKQNRAGSPVCPPSRWTFLKRSIVVWVGTTKRRESRGASAQSTGKYRCVLTNGVARRAGHRVNPENREALSLCTSPVQDYLQTNLFRNFTVRWTSARYYCSSLGPSHLRHLRRWRLPMRMPSCAPAACYPGRPAGDYQQTSAQNDLRPPTVATSCLPLMAAKGEIQRTSARWSLPQRS